jgi:hypothetical protein
LLVADDVKRLVVEGDFTDDVVDDPLYAVGSLELAPIGPPSRELCRGDVQLANQRDQLWVAWKRAAFAGKVPLTQ